MKFDVPVEVKSADVELKRGTSKAGKPYEIREQHAYINLGKAYPVEFRFSLDEGRAAYSPGNYIVDPSCLYVDRYGQLALGRIRLLPGGSQG